MDKIWINELINNVHHKICEIVNVWCEIGVSDEKLITRSNSLKQHIDNLLTDMLEEECQHKNEVEKSIDCLYNDIKSLCVSLKVEYNIKLDELSLVKTEDYLLKKKFELLTIKDLRMKRFHDLLNSESQLCERLFEYKLNLDPDLIPTEQQLDDLDKKILYLENIKINRRKEFLVKRKNIMDYFTLLDKSIPNDSFVESIFTDEDVVDIPLSMDFLNQCDILLNQVKLEYQKNIEECNKLRDRFEILHRILFSSIDFSENNNYLSKNSNQFNYTVLNLLKNDVSRLENIRLEKIGDFIKTYQSEIREKLRNNFSSHLENNDHYKLILNSDSVNESLLDTLEAEFDKWCALEIELIPLKNEMNTWDKLFKKLIEININLKNPVILKNRGGILLKVEKEKNSIKKDLPRCEMKIRSILILLAENNIQSCDLRINRMNLSDYMTFMWSQAEGEKENERKERKMKVITSKMDISKSITVKKPLQITQQKFIADKSNKNIEFKKPDIIKPNSKIPLKKNLLSPISKNSNLDRRFSKSYNSLNTKSLKKTLHGSTDNVYEMFCKNIQVGAITSSFHENLTTKRK